MRTRKHLLFVMLWQLAIGLSAQEKLPEQIIALNAEIEQLEQKEQSGPALDSLYQKKLQLLKQGDQLTAYLNAAWNWQANYFDQNNKALTILQQALNGIWRKPETSEAFESLMWVHINRGYHLFQIGRVIEAIHAYEEAAKLHEKHQFKEFPAADYLYLPLGAHYTRLGDNEKARAVYLKALQDPTLTNQSPALAGIYNNIGLSYWNDGNNEQAIQWYRKGLELPGLPPEKRGMLLTALARSLAENNQRTSAIREANKALQLLKKAYQQHKDEYRAYHLAGAYALLGELSLKENTQSAFQNFQQALQYLHITYPSGQHREIAKVQIKTGKLLLENGHTDEALTAFRKALQSLLPQFKPQQENFLPDNNDLYAENALQEALQGIADALSSAPNSTPEMLQQALRAHQLAAQVQELLYQSYRYQSSKLLLQAQARQYSEKAISLCFRLFKKTNDQQYARLAFQLAEQHKARLLRDNLRQNLLQKQTPESQLFQQKTSIQQQIAFLERQILSQPESENTNHLRQQLDQFIEELFQINQKIAETHPRISQNLKQNELDINKLCAKLPDNTPLLVYFFGSNNLYSWILKPSGQLHFFETSLTQNSITPKIKTINQLLTQRNTLAKKRDQFAELASRLYQQLYPKAWQNDPPDQVLIIPDGFLYHLPFEALLTQLPIANTSWADWPFLINQQQIHYAYSAGVWLEQSRIAPRGNKLLCVTPDFAPDDPRQLPPLSRAENLFSAFTDCQFLSDSSATASAFRQMAPHYHRLHLHTHAISDGTPRIELSDSALFLPDIYALPLQTELVVLSACQTGSGQLLQGEGAMSLARAFSYAGTRDLIASLWKVNEKSTTTLFLNFYQYLHKGYTHGQALRQAKLDYLNNPQIENWEKSPYYWAAFVPIGHDTKPFGKMILWPVLIAFFLLLSWLLLRKLFKNK